MYKKILVPVDMGREKNAIKLCKAAKDFATEDSEIRLITVAPGYGMSVVASFFPADAQEKATKKLGFIRDLSNDVKAKAKKGQNQFMVLSLFGVATSNN